MYFVEVFHEIHLQGQQIGARARDEREHESRNGARSSKSTAAERCWLQNIALIHKGPLITLQWSKSGKCRVRWAKETKMRGESRIVRANLKGFVTLLAGRV